MNNMDDFIRVNGPRVGKILATLQMIAKSAKSYRVTDEEANSLLKPIVVWAQKQGEQEEPPVMTTNPGGQHTHLKSHWNDVIQMARTAPLKDAITAMSIIASRVEEELDG